METRIKEPQTLKAKVMLWTDVSYHDMEEVDKMQSVPDLESALCSVFGIDLPEPRRGVLLEMYVQTVLFCREHSFKKEQTSALLSIIKSIHEANIQTPLNNIEQCFKYCKELLLCHSVRRPPFSINLFSSEEVKLDLSLIYSGIPDQDKHTMEDSSAPAEAKTDSGPQTQEASIAESEGDTLGSNSELKALIEKEVKEQMMLVSGQLDQRMKEIAGQHNRALESPQLNHKAKK